MTPKIFLNQLDDARIVEAIGRAELQTSGEIRVYIFDGDVSDPLEAAKRQFTKMGMEKTAERNGVLIYIAPKSQKFAIVGDSAIHQKCGVEFWSAITEKMRASLKENKYTEALLIGIDEIGRALGCNFPRRGDDRNELPNKLEGN